MFDRLFWTIGMCDLLQHTALFYNLNFVMIVSAAKGHRVGLRVLGTSGDLKVNCLLSL